MPENETMLCSLEKAMPGSGFASTTDENAVAPCSQASLRPARLPELRFKPLVPGCALVTLHVDQLRDRFLPPEEVELVQAGATQKHKSEFALGRIAARQALVDLGFADPPPVLRSEVHEPLWPEGLVGSITHCSSWAIASVARREDAMGMRIDLEDVQRVPQKEIVSLVCSGMERQWIFDGEDSQLRMAMLFSAKESIYKLLYPFVQCFFDFHAVELAWVPDRQLCFALRSDFPRGYTIAVRCQRQANFVFTHAILPPEEKL